MIDLRPIQIAMLATLLVFGAGFARAADRAELAQMAEQMFAPTVQLEHNCTGTVVYSGARKPPATGNVTLILTARHCVDGVKGVMIVNVPVYQDGRVVKEEAYKAKVRTRSGASDLALIELIDSRTVFPGLVLLAPAGAMPLEGEDVFTVGYSAGMVRTVTEGLFGSRQWLVFEGSEREYFRATPQIAGGNSGGVLFARDAAGRYVQVGVTVLGSNQSDFIGLYVPIDQIHDFLKRAAPEIQAAASRAAALLLP